MDKKSLGELLLQVSLLRGDFTLRSGRKSSFYFDKYRFETRPDLLRPVAEHLAAMLPKDVDRVAGAELGGLPLATAVALLTGSDLVSLSSAENIADVGRLTAKFLL